MLITSQNINLKDIAALPCETVMCQLLASSGANILLSVGPVSVSKLGVTKLMFVDAGVKIDIAYYRNVLLSQQLLSAIVRFLANSSFFSRTVPRHTGHVTPPVSWNVTHLHSSRQICGRRIAQAVIGLIQGLGVMQHRIYQTNVKDLDDLKRHLIEVWAGIQQSLIDVRHHQPVA